MEAKQKDNTENLGSLVTSLQIAMEKEVRLLRELLSSTEAEQNALLMNASQEVMRLVQPREALLDRLTQMHNERNVIVQKIESLLQKEENIPIEESEFLSILDHPLVTNSELQVLKQQMVSLLERMNTNNFRNSYLLKNKVLHTRDLFSRLQPKKINTTYGLDGCKKPASKLPGAAVINKEV